MGQAAARQSAFAIFMAVLLAGASAAQTERRPLAFELTFTPEVAPRPFTGRVLVMLGTGAGEPRRGPNWFRPQPFFAMDVKDWQPGAPLVFKDQFSFPRPLAELAPGEYAVQAVMDFDRGHREVGTAPGNGYSASARLALDPQSSGTINLKIDRVVAERHFRESDSVKLFEMESKLLSEFHKRPMKLRAGVVLPRSYAANPEKKYPVIYDIPGFGGDHFGAHFGQGRTNVAGVEMLYVVLDPNCRTGHHVFADSANNGPWGRALTEEFIPALEQRFRAIGNPAARFVTGHSSGGWSSLWLQVAYPDCFGGCWSTAPDPIDFRDFQRINLYQAGANMFKDEAGNDRPLARDRRGQPVIFYRTFSDMEEVMGHGGQLASFEAVFSPQGPDGRPRKLWDRRTGAIDPETAKAWQAYDINLILQRNWPALGPKLKGKIHIYMGGADTFYLEGATKLVKETLTGLGSDAIVEIVPGRDHGTLMDAGMVGRIKKEMAEQFQKHASPQP